MNNLFNLNPDLDAALILTDNNRLYFSGYHADDSALIVFKDRSVLVTDKRYYSEAVKNNSFDTVLIESDLFATIYNILEKNRVKNLGFENNILFNQYKKLTEYENINLFDISLNIEKLRAIKNSYEINLMQKANQICDVSLSNLLPLIKEGVTEKELAFRLDNLMRLNGADKEGFETIVAFGKNSAVPHHKSDDTELNFGDVVLIDFGASISGYKCDMTRTFAFKNVSDKVAEIYDIVYNANIEGINYASAGVAACDLHKKVFDYIDKKGYKNYFTHSTGHGVGLEIHEAPFVGFRNKDILSENNVVTVEPGIYIDGLFGIRIEDMILIGKDGSRSFTGFDKKLLIL